MSTRDTPIELCWRPGCPYCISLRARLARTGLRIWERNIWQDQDAAARVRAVAGGNETVPTVFVGDEGMVNPSPRRVLAAVREHAPELLPAPRESRWSRLWTRRR